MAEWISIDRWPDCVRLERPGYVFELANVDGQSLLTRCGPMPEKPFDWKSPPVRFRLVAEPPPVRSAPLPAPAKR